MRNKSTLCFFLHLNDSGCKQMKVHLNCRVMLVEPVISQFVSILLSINVDIFVADHRDHFDANIIKQETHELIFFKLKFGTFT